MPGRPPALKETSEGRTRMELRLPLHLKRAVAHEAMEQGKASWEIIAEALEGHEPLKKWLEKGTDQKEQSDAASEG